VVNCKEKLQTGFQNGHYLHLVENEIEKMGQVEAKKES